jgi:hypothetical protein
VREAESVSKAILCSDVYIPEQELPERALDDRYITPQLECEQAYAMLMKWEPLWGLEYPFLNKHCMPRAPYILDPGAGPGIWGNVARKIWPAATIHGVDIQSQEAPGSYDKYTIGSFPEVSRLRGYDLIVGNPPYDQANRFVEESLRRLGERGWLIFLMPLRYCTGSRRRDGLFSDHPLFLYAVYSRRISWRPDGKRKTPPRDHALFVWQRGYEGPAHMDLIGRKEDPTLPELLAKRDTKSF